MSQKKKNPLIYRCKNCQEQPRTQSCVACACYGEPVYLGWAGLLGSSWLSAGLLNISWISFLSRSSYTCRFFVLPCCFFDFVGRYRRRQSKKTQYREYLDFVLEVGLSCGFHVQEDCLRIPSTKRVCARAGPGPGSSVCFA